MKILLLILSRASEYIAEEADQMRQLQSNPGRRVNCREELSSTTQGTKFLNSGFGN